MKKTYVLIAKNRTDEWGPDEHIVTLGARWWCLFALAAYKLFTPGIPARVEEF